VKFGLKKRVPGLADSDPHDPMFISFASVSECDGQMCYTAECDKK